MGVNYANKQALRGWTDGPKFVFDLVGIWNPSDFPEGTTVIKTDATRLEELMDYLPPSATVYVTGPEEIVELLQCNYKNNFFKLMVGRD